MDNIGVLVAFVAGIISFLSPCVLPVVPGYVSSISGLSLSEQTDEREHSGLAFRAAMNSLLFGFGFTVVFVAMGASATLIGQFLFSHLSILKKVAGALVILFGLYLSGLIPIKALNQERRFHPVVGVPGVLTPLILGSAFAFGWTPCLGPILGGILTYASIQSTVGQGVLLLIVYSLGLGVPFFLTAIGLDTFFKVYRRVRRYFRVIQIVSGVLLVAIGVLIFTENLERLAYIASAW